MIEELKRNILRKVEYREAIPQPINEVVERCFSDILEIYRSRYYNSSTIEEYIEGARQEVNAMISKIGEDRKNIQFQELQHIIFKIQNKVEEKETRNEQIDKQDILNKLSAGLEQAAKKAANPD